MSAAGTAWRSIRVVHQGELSPMQRRILAMLEMGKRQAAIARALNMTPEAVRQHVERIRDWQAFQAMQRAKEEP